jgi:hypothetical protein
MTGVLLPSVKGLSKAIHMEPDASQFDVATAAALGVASRGTGGLPKLE